MLSAQGLAGLAVFTMALAGGLLGFLPYNFPKARIYLGDAGSLFIGLTLGSREVCSQAGWSSEDRPHDPRAGI